MAALFTGLAYAGGVPVLVMVYLLVADRLEQHLLRLEPAVNTMTESNPASSFPEHSPSAS